METAIRLPTHRELIQEKYIAPAMACRLNDHAHDLVKDRKYQLAEIAMKRALAIAPDHPMLLSQMGSILYELCRYSEAETVLRKSIAIEGEYSPSRGALGSVLSAQNRFDEAREQFEIALKIEPDYTDGIWNWSMVLLDHGRWQEAWPKYNERKTRLAPFFPKMPYPYWDGEDLNGKTLLVYGEQGAGDRILFSRYLHWVKSTWPDCRLMWLAEAPDLPDLSNLFWALREIVEFVPFNVPWPKADYGIYLIDLVTRHGSTPGNVYPDPGIIRDYIARSGKSVSVPTANGNEFKIGINWTGSPAMLRNSERSVPPELIFTLAASPDLVCYSLQYGTRDIERLGAGQLVCDLTADISKYGFLGTAAVMQQLDLFITNCTSTAHLAGVLGVPCWTLLCANPYWIWGRSGEASVWYPNMRLIRQEKMHDWEPVISKVKSELFALAADHVRNDRRQAA